jgi:hypothetical protein
VQWNIRLARANGRWRIVEVKNVQQILQRFQQQHGMGGAPSMPPEMGGAPGAAPPSEAAPEGGGTPTSP